MIPGSDGAGGARDACYPGLVPPNILLLVFDTARADALEPYGAQAGAGPVTADLAARGVAVPSVYATSNWTLPSHASMFSGLLPRPLGLGIAGMPRAAISRHADRMLAAVLREAGYETRAVSANPWISPRNGFDAGFERFVEVGGGRRQRAPVGIRRRTRWALDAVRAKVDDGLAEADSVVRSWLREPRSRPFFWFVNLMECHSPYLPPKPYNDLRLLERLRAGEDARRFQSPEGFVRACLGEIEVPDSSLVRMRHLYARCVRAMDDWLGRLLEELEARRLLDETLVVVTSDHGENFGEQHLIGHGLSLDDRLLRVPLVMAGPGARAPEERPVSLSSLPRMLAEAAGLDRHPWEQPAVSRGIAVAQDDGLSGMSPEVVERLIRRWNLAPASAARMRARSACASDGRFKLVRVGSEERLHELAADPLEERDVSGEHPAEAAHLRAVLEAADPPPALEPSASSPYGEGDAAALEERMKMLGYL